MKNVTFKFGILGHLALVKLASCNSDRQRSDDATAAQWETEGRRAQPPFHRTRENGGRFFDSQLRAASSEENISKTISHLKLAAIHVQNLEDLDDLLSALGTANISSSEESAILAASFGSLAEKGHTDKAIKKLLEDFGPGDNRTALITTTLSRSSSDTSELLAIASAFEYDDERAAGLRVVIGRLRYNIDSDLVAYSAQSLAEGNKELAGMIGEAVGIAISNPNKKNNSLELLVKQGAENQAFLTGFFTYASGDQIERFWPSFEAEWSSWTPGNRDLFLQAAALESPRESPGPPHFGTKPHLY